MTAPQVLVPACLAADFDSATGTCAQEIWIPQPSLIPALTIEEAQDIGGAAAFLLATAFIFRRIRKFIDQA
jgi:hypothetical protein